ncbi:MAG: hypothetical protein LBR81_03530 [Prevotellaceae bacterium]|jgi:antitoxin component YwqK of YwqJK toxin-antitoxin module|nr:hypothetical protein [Prevotellaceae bacterium]
MKNSTKLFEKNKHIVFLCLLLAVGTATANTQNYRKNFEERKKYHHFQLADSLYKYNIVVLAVAPAKIKPNKDKFYTWYINNTVNTTQGNYSGKLLHGVYNQYFIDSKQLAVKGNYEHGLRVGNWYEWHENGNLSSVVAYKSGKKQGQAFFYDISGNIVEKCRFKNDQKHGKSIAYIDGRKQAPIKYKNGEAVPKKEKKISEAKEEKPKKEKKFKLIKKEKKTNDNTAKEKKEPFYRKIFKGKKVES